MELRQKLWLALSILITGCANYDYKKTKDGLVYKIFSDGKGAAIRSGQMLKISIVTSIGDSTMVSTINRIPAYGTYDSSITNVHDFIEFLGEMRVGDSAVYVRLVDTLQKRRMLTYGGVFKKGSTIKGQIKILKSFKNEAQMNADYEKEADMEKQREIAGFRQYLSNNEISNARQMPGGIWIVIEREGNGPFADSGNQVKVNYTGYLKNGRKFDSNTDIAFKHVKPFEFVVGARQIIAGWDEGIRLFRQGSKGKLYIPAMLAYGPQPQGEKIPAYSDLIFDIEVLDVKPAVQNTNISQPLIKHPAH